MTIEQQVLEKLRDLPPEKQKEVLEFVHLLKEKNGTKKPLRSLRGLWARISLLVFAGILVFYSVVGEGVTAITPFPPNTVNNPSLPANFMVMLREGFVLFFAVCGALGDSGCIFSIRGM